mmetsp:Transcript_164156/g.526386  ORF Transcript_164156/g.526386 Transcript_164156/m.526386 type:complete len:313 (-) Transcript_164156:74-1012(-)
MTVTKRPDPLPHDAKVRPGRALGVEVESHAGACDVTRQIEELHLVAHLASSEPRGSGVLERTLKPKRCWGRSRRFIPCRARHARPHLVGARRDLHTAALHLVELQVAGIINLLVRGMFAVPRRWHFLLLPQPAQLVQDNLLRAPHVLLLGTRDNEKTFVILHGRVCVLAPLAKVRRCPAHEFSAKTGLDKYLHDELFPHPLALDLAHILFPRIVLPTVGLLLLPAFWLPPFGGLLCLGVLSPGRQGGVAPCFALPGAEQDFALTDSGGAGGPRAPALLLRLLLAIISFVVLLPDILLLFKATLFNLETALLI